MTALETYENFLIKLNKNDSNANINVPRGKFVISYNEHAKGLLQQKLKKKLGTNELDELSSLLTDDVELVVHSTHIDHVDFVLPSDFFDISSSFSLAEKKGCKRIIDNWPVKDKNVRVLLRDANYKPSFEYEETLCTAANDKLKVYIDNFNLDKVYLSYYRQPRNIDVEGYIKSNNQPSANIDPDIPDFLVHQIINRCVLDFQGITENRDGYEVSKQRLDLEN